MTAYAIVSATPAHVEALQDHLRKADLDELAAAAGVAPGTALREGIRSSLEAWVGLADGVPFCLFGLAPASLLGGSAIPWLLGTDGMDRHAAGFLRRCRPVVDRWAGMFPDLWNHVDARNLKAIRWLRWLGFTIHPAAPYGVQQLPIHRFDLMRRL